MSSWVASIPSPGPEWQEIPLPFWPYRIQVYALVILVGIIIAAAWTSRRLTKRGAEPGVILDILLWAVVLGIVGARIYHVLTHPSDYFAAGHNTWNPFQPGSVWAIWEGGNAIFGSLIGGAVGVWIACRISGLRFWSVADALAPALLLAQAIGRIGNYFNQELFGLPTNLPWGLQIDAGNKAIPVGLPDGTLFQPLFLYEIIWNVIGVFVIVYLERKFRLQWGKTLAVYLIWYGLGRSYLESIRIDPSEFTFLGIPSNVWAAFAAVVLGVVIFVVQSRRHPGLEPSVYHTGREWVRPDAEVDSDDTDSDDEDFVDGDGEPTASAGAKATSPSNG
ncbi:prolipoprotein diacylglyceryl transferase [Leifsonia sp. TF02-11]|uniref:prolipoprotein diacylglyceryl transferase n=1 Tax=Leifsonia sp. TF02-11 TaxID=2815212 RepID=UPI001AA1304E|nr:prolipoprotein diacylglyceryl transferase [Leifsonia sp. TF02-11]MBN9632913.1 prolipoprotein diacylglyceryl transferase [Actinomycetota bacterium]MBO1738462.1 prolipoprotein diacylglyceryl transferase [Leifsonia sp. TF02-11]